MKCLIIEDDKNKSKQILASIMDFDDSMGTVIKHSFNSGMAEILNTDFDFLILDMTMPTFDKSPSESGGRVRAFGGREILERMSRKKVIVPVIVVTQFDVIGEGDESLSLERLDMELSNKFSNIYVGSVYYNAAQDKWKDDLHAKLTEIKNA